MKKLLSFFLTLSLFLVTSCDDGVYDFSVADLVREPELSLDELEGLSTITIGYKEGAYFKSDVTTTTSGISITTSEGADEWLDVTLNSDESRVTFLALSENDGDAARSATVEFRAGKLYLSVKVYQSIYEPDYDLPTYEGYPNTTPLKVGGLTPDGKGMVFYVDPNDNTKGKAISLTAVKGAFYTGVTNKSFGAKSEYNGVSNTHKFPEEADAFAYCTEYGEHWYIPSYDELLFLFNIYNGKSVTKRDETYNGVPDATVESVARNGFESDLVGLGGAPLNSSYQDTNEAGDCIWSSSENQSVYNDSYFAMRYVRFGQYNYEMSADKDVADEIYYRPMQIIGSYTFEDYITESYIETVEAGGNYISLSSDAGQMTKVELISEASFLTVNTSDIAVDEGLTTGWFNVSVSGYTVTVRSLTTNYSCKARTASIPIVDKIGGASIDIGVSQPASDSTSIITIPTWEAIDIAVQKTAVVRIHKLLYDSGQVTFAIDSEKRFTLSTPTITENVDNSNYYDYTFRITSYAEENLNASPRTANIFVYISDSTITLPLVQAGNETEIPDGGGPGEGGEPV